ncbi:DNA-3-methyladenine glycosylase [bacterium]|nr:DNA-3-methyladenine glycosylase [bacterium]
MKIIPRKFYNRDSVKVAKELLGSYLSLKAPKGTIFGKIVETEAYHQNDPASHSHRGITPRNKPMFGPPGHAYVYFVYGMYFCFNVTTEPEGYGGAVLIRAIEPIKGIEIMQKNRKQKNISNLTNGPGKLAQAYGITKKHNGWDLTKSKLKILENNKKEDIKIIKCKRIGISQAEHALMRFYIKGNPFVSVL